MKNISLLFIAAVLFYGCRDNGSTADAFGNFETTEVIVSAETAGRVLKCDVSEGSSTAQGDVLAVIDTAIITLQMGEIDAGMKSVSTRISSVNAQNEILEQQIKNINVNIGRTEKMLKDEAATQKQYDDLTGQVEVLRKQIAANNTQKSSIASELAVYEAKKATLQEQIRRSVIKSPISGSVLEKYIEAGEITAPGRPVVKLADISMMRLRAWVSGAGLARIKTGQSCTVRIDDGKKGFRSYSATISYISEKAEFTPKIIQTKEERVNLVYAVKIDVVNDGSIKAGMPGEVIFENSTAR